MTTGNWDRLNWRVTGLLLSEVEYEDCEGSERVPRGGEFFTHIHPDTQREHDGGNWVLEAAQHYPDGEGNDADVTAFIVYPSEEQS